MARVQAAIATIAPKDSVERYGTLGVDCVLGDAEIVSPHEIRVGDERVLARRIVVASGAGPLVPPIPGLDGIEYLTSENIWSLEALPGRLVVLGAGPIGCELAQAFARLGSDVTLVDMAERVLPREDPDASEVVAESLRADGIEIRLNAAVTSVGTGAVETGPVPFRSISCWWHSGGGPARLASVSPRSASRSSATAPSRSTSTCAPPFVRSLQPVMSSAPTSSLTWPRTRPGMPR